VYYDGKTAIENGSSGLMVRSVAGGQKHYRFMDEKNLTDPHAGQIFM